MYRLHVVCRMTTSVENLETRKSRGIRHRSGKSRRFDEQRGRSQGKVIQITYGSWKMTVFNFSTCFTPLLKRHYWSTITALKFVTWSQAPFAVGQYQRIGRISCSSALLEKSWQSRNQCCLGNGSGVYMSVRPSALAEVCPLRVLLPSNVEIADTDQSAAWSRNCGPAADQHSSLRLYTSYGYIFQPGRSLIISGYQACVFRPRARREFNQHVV